MIEIHIDLKKLQAMAVLAPKNDSRAHLCGVHVEADSDETRLVATDGIAMGALRGAQPEGMTNTLDGRVAFTIPNDVIDRMKPGRTTAPVATVLIEHVRESYDKEPAPRYTVRLIDGTLIPFQPPPGQFPQFRRVLPYASPSNPLPDFDVLRLAAFAKVQKLLGAPTHLQGKLLLDSVGKMVRIQLPKAGPPTTVDPDFLGVLMGLKTNEVPRSTSHVRWPE